MESLKSLFPGNSGRIMLTRIAMQLDRADLLARDPNLPLDAGTYLKLTMAKAKLARDAQKTR